MTHSVLVIDDDTSSCDRLVERLDASRFEVFCTSMPEHVEGLLRERPFDAVLTDAQVQRLDGIALCSRLLERHPGLPVVVMAAFGSIETAVRAMRAGASDFLTKPIDLELFNVTLERAIAHASLRREVAELRRELGAIGAETNELVALEEIERRYILRVLTAVQGNKSRAAQVLGLDRKTLYRRLERYGAAGEPPAA